jgi:hypothetical protein
MQRRNSPPKLDRHMASSRSLRRSLTRSGSDLLKKLSPSKDRPSGDPALNYALDLLQLRDFDALEEHFLKTDAFLRPWAHFRDTFLLMPSRSSGSIELVGRATSKTELLYWYTLFEEGEKRYEPLADEAGSQYTTDESKYGLIDRSTWTVGEHEKLLYVWLLQAFKVGKVHNPYGFTFFECRNVCMAWEKVLVPIVAAVRNEYTAKGRYHYGRLAKFIEDICPSRLAFPEGNVGLNLTTTALAQPIGFTKRPDLEMDPITGVLKNKKVWDEEDKELREVFPQYGQVVERPKVKVRITEWVRDQKSKVQRSKTLNNLESGSPGLGLGGLWSKRTAGGGMKSSKQSSIAHDSDHGSMYQVNSVDNSLGKKQPKRLERDKSDYSLVDNNEPSPRLSFEKPRYRLYPSPNDKFQRQGSDGVYSSIRSSNPYSYAGDDASIFGPGQTHSRQASNHSDRSIAIQAQAKPSPLDRPFGGHQRDLSSGSHQWASASATSRPSYEGNGYGGSVLPTLSETSLAGNLQTRIPSPVGSVATDLSLRKYHPIVEKAVVLAETSPLMNSPPPPLPSKNPGRFNSARSHIHPPRSAPFALEANMLGPRIISKENIRAALDNLRREDSEESLTSSRRPGQGSVSDQHDFARIGGRGLNTGESPTFPTFNKHLFPREGHQTAVGGKRRRSDQSVGYELQHLKGMGRTIQ